MQPSISLLKLQESAHALIESLLKTLLESDNYGERRGAAFGLAGVVQGIGIVALKYYGIMDTLKKGMENKYTFSVVLFFLRLCSFFLLCYFSPSFGHSLGPILGQVFFYFDLISSLRRTFVFLETSLFFSLHCSIPSLPVPSSCF